MKKNFHPVISHAKIVILGELGVGKTSLRKNFMGVGFEANYSVTIGVDFANKSIKVDRDNTVNLQIWDIAGQSSFLKVTKLFLENTHGALLVYDLTQPDTFEKLKYWLERLYEMNKERADKIPYIIIGNKVDLKNSKVISKDEAEQAVDFVSNYNKFSTQRKFLSTSAKTGENIETAFLTLSKKLIPQ